jgi:hypothetical protein
MTILVFFKEVFTSQWRVKDFFILFIFSILLDWHILLLFLRHAVFFLWLCWKSRSLWWGWKYGGYRVMETGVLGSMCSLVQQKLLQGISRLLQSVRRIPCSVAVFFYNVDYLWSERFLEPLLIILSDIYCNTFFINAKLSSWSPRTQAWT